MKRNYFLIIVAVALVCLFLIFFSLWREIERPITKTPLPTPWAPYKSYISGVGIVEASSENISVGAPLNRIIKKIFVNTGQKVKKGDLLFQLEDADLKANFLEQKAALKTASAKLQKLEELPRPEDLAAAEASLNHVKAEWDLAKSQYDMALKLPDPRAISQEERDRRLSAYRQAKAKWEQAQADYEKIKAGAWKPDLEIARSEVQQAKANLYRIRTEIERTQIRSPIDGTVLQVKVHEGELPSADVFRSPMMILGNTDALFLRVSINQFDIPFFHKNAPAVAFLQGDGKREFPLEFVRIEPLLTNKQNLTNGITEKVDTRVLNIIYQIKKEEQLLFPGQQMDVFIETQYPDESQHAQPASR